MNTYYCKNCKFIIGNWSNTINNYNIFGHCNIIFSKTNISIMFMNCKNCKKFVGLQCFYVCINCFGKDIIIGEENLKKWFLEYKKTTGTCLKIICEKCKKSNFRTQCWFFEELTFCKINYKLKYI